MVISAVLPLFPRVSPVMLPNVKPLNGQVSDEEKLVLYGCIVSVPELLTARPVPPATTASPVRKMLLLELVTRLPAELL